MRIPYEQAVENLDLLVALRPFDPIVIGTPPLGIDLPESDIDIACSCKNVNRFAEFATRQFESQHGFQMRSATTQDYESITIQFHAFEWDVEIFCQPIPTNKQWGVRHFRIEQRLLALFPELKSSVLELKRSGLKTEPAFAKVLGLPGDPYIAMLEIESANDQELLALAEMRKTEG